MRKNPNPHKQRLTITDIQKAINGESVNLRTKSVPTPSAQSAKLCFAGGDLEQLLRSVESSLQALQRSNPPVYLIAMILFESGCRVSEVLAITSTDITPEGRVLIRGKKRSNNRVIHPISVAPLLIDYRRKQGLIFADYSRFHVHREFKRVGLSFVFNGRSKHSVTHLFRHLVAIDLQQTDDPTTAILTGLGHKSENSADHYRHETISEMGAD